MKLGNISHHPQLLFLPDLFPQMLTESLVPDMGDTKVWIKHRVHTHRVNRLTHKKYKLAFLTTVVWSYAVGSGQVRHPANSNNGVISC